MKADPMCQLITLGLLFAPISLPPGLAENRKTEQAQSGLAKPFLLEANDRPLVREDATPLFPFVGDFYGDGRAVLLLGAPGGGSRDVLGNEDGRLLLFRNVGSKARPRLAGPRWLDELAPTGVIPRG
jgi:hypothetical protein